MINITCIMRITVCISNKLGSINNKEMNKTLNKIIIIATIITILSCEGEIGPIGLTSLINLSGEPVGDNCTSGGHKIETGIDTNNNGTLDSDEVQSTQYICNGTDGLNGQSSLVDVTEEPVGANCSSGGFKIDVGLDTNGNGILDSDEVQSTQYVCNGTDGLNGQSSLVDVTEEPVGANCSSGGFKIDVGLDTNGNGILDSYEVQSTQYVCNALNNSDNEVRFEFDWSGGLSWSTSSSQVIGGSFGITNFNINNFVGVDSVALGALLRTSNISTNCILELYDFTNNTVIVNSIVSSNSTSEVWSVTTQNFLNNLPNETVDLGLRLTSDNGANVIVKHPILFLYRN